MEEKRKDTYIWPELAVSNMEAAQQVKKPVYLYGDSGCGKTVFVKRYLLTRGSDDDRYVYLQAEELTSRRLEKIAGDREVTVLVLDVSAGTVGYGRGRRNKGADLQDS